MKKCSTNNLLISRYADNDLGPISRRLLEKHLTNCQECTRVFGQYMALKNLINESYSVGIPDVQATVISKTRVDVNTAFSMHAWGLKLAAMMIIAGTLFAGIYLFSSARQKLQMPLVLESESRQVMNTPICALAYYEEFAGITVHAQYTRIKESALSKNDGLRTDWSRISGYKSPLFGDSSVLERRYNAIANKSVF
jgi:hypothetical protein